MTVDKVVAIVMAGGIGERLQPLTRERAKAAVPFAGKYRLIDFTLSNCINSGIRQVFVLTQYRSSSLNRHVQEGWGISSSRLGDYIYCIPAQQKLGTEWYRGTADSVRQNLDIFRSKDIEDVLILSGDHVYKMNYLQMLSFHRARKSDLTVSALRVRREEVVDRLGVLEVDKDFRVIGFEEKPVQPKTIVDAPDYALASMSIYAFRVGALIEALQGSEYDFGRDIIPKMISNQYDIFAYDYGVQNRIEDFATKVKEGKRNKVLVHRTRDSSYWRDVGTIDSYYEASMDLLSVDPLFNLYGEKWPIRTYEASLAPSKHVLGGISSGSLLCDGCIISGGEVKNSILSPGVIVERGALIEQSIIFNNVTVETNARIKRAIVDKESKIQANVSIGYDQEADKKRGCEISRGGITVVPKRAEIDHA
jgi:glucose-1-phosphate adenylyltransferase